ncbi:MAG: glycoside hydrolase family 99-like domain-containing protein, partial [Oscillospiraceae bacterium]|nr:glycoside hydrolase family 99-like domain-containing protein [Oscillospiraceae bacterium]
MQEFKSIDEAVLKIKELEKELYETEVKLCKNDIEKNEYLKQYSKSERERIKLLNEVVKLRVDVVDISRVCNEMRNSNVWKKTRAIRNGINRLRSFGRKTRFVPEEDDDILIGFEQEEDIVEENNAGVKTVKETVKVYEDNVDYSSLSTDIKPVVFYHDNGDTDRDTLEKDIILARQHGVYGFAFENNWSENGMKISSAMKKLMSCQEKDFNFLSIWAIDSLDIDLSETASRAFLENIKEYILTDNHIKYNSKPVICISNPDSVPNTKAVFKIWKKVASEILGTDVAVWTVMPDVNGAKADYLKYTDALYQSTASLLDTLQNVDTKKSRLSDYRQLVEEERHFSAEDYNVPVFRTNMVKWDNKNCSAEDYYIWNCVNTAYTRHSIEEDNRFVFVNGWNNHNDGMYIEPDAENGYAALNALSKAIYNLPYDVKDFKKFDQVGFWKTSLSEDDICYTGGDLVKTVLPQWDSHLKSGTRIAVQAHVFYPELIADTCEYLDNIPYAYDLYVTTNERYKASYIKEYLKEHCSASRFFVDVVANKGRDVMPFIIQMKPYINQYEYICHIHTKKSLHNDVGDIWRKYLYDNLIGSPEIARQIFYLFESQQDIGVILPENMANLKVHMIWGENKQYGEWLFNRMNMEKSKLVEDIIFPAGNMFWARTAAVKDVFEINYKDSDFPEESGQVDGTIMHAIERIWLYVAEENGYKYQLIRNVQDD